MFCLFFIIENGNIAFSFQGKSKDEVLERGN